MAFDGDEKRESRITGPRELVLKGALRRSAERIETKTEKQTPFSVLSMFSRAGWLRQGEGGWRLRRCKLLFPAASEALGFISDRQCAVMFRDCNNSSRDKHFLKEIAVEMNRSDGFAAPFPVTTFMLTVFSNAKFPLFKTH